MAERFIVETQYVGSERYFVSGSCPTRQGAERLIEQLKRGSLRPIVGARITVERLKDRKHRKDRP